MKQLSGMDASFIHLERNKNKFQVGTLLFYDVSTAKNGFVRFKDILETFETRVDKDSILRKKIQRVPFNLDHPYWVNDPDFEIEHHVRHIALPKPGDWRQLCILVARMHSRPLDFGKPLWEVYVIEGLDNVKGIPKGGFAVYVKLHHASIDGIAGNDLVTAIHDQEPFPKKRKSNSNADSDMSADNLSTVDMLTRAYSNLLRQPKRVFDLAQTALPAWNRIRKAKEDHLFTPLGVPQHTRFNEHISGNLVLDAAIFDFEEMRQIKNTVPEVTINDVMLAIVSGAMLKYLSSKNETPAKNLSAGMPINIRPFIDNLSEQDSSNLVTIAKVNLKNTIKDPIERLKAIHKSATESKAYQNAMGAKVMLEVGRSMPALLTSIAARAVPTLMTGDDPVVNTVITNVPGSQKPLYMGGAKLAGMCNLGIVVEGLGIFHAVSSYCGTATISFQSCRKMMPDPEFYKTCIDEAFSELKLAAKKSKDTSPAKKTAVKKRPAKKKAAAKKVVPLKAAI